MSELRPLDAPDLQADAPEVGLALTRAGVVGVEKAIPLRHGGRDLLVPARIRCTVELGAAQRGVHMSRFPELLDEAVALEPDALAADLLAERLAQRIRERQSAARAEVRVEARLPLERLTPVTRLATRELVTVLGIAAATAAGTRRAVGVEAVGINACPCAQALVRAGATERLAEAGFGDADVERILDLVPLATHNQRARGTLVVGTAHELDPELLVDIVEGSMSAPILELLKRPDELFVVEHAHLRPRFVEDSVRAAIAAVLARLPQLEPQDFVLSRQVNFETIHAHDVEAERAGTVAELRHELETGAPPPRHTELQDWLRT